jgi:thiamine biosynthesis lipoprotein
MNRREIVSLVILLVVVSYGAYKYITREYVETRSKYMLDTIVEISAASKSKTVGTDIENIFSYIKEMEQKFNEYDPQSMISKINMSSETEFEMDPDLFNLLQLADSLWQISDGNFDPTIKPVWDLWAFNTPNPVVPDSLTLSEALKDVGFARIQYDEDTLTKPQGMQLTLGAFAKGYILDKAIAKMKQQNLLRGFINCRSSMRFFGFSVAPLVYIQHPRNKDDSIASFRINDLSVGTSGDYQQYFDYENVRYHHILNAKTGKPVENIFSVTVVSESAALADGLSTALFTMNPDTALETISDMENTNCVIYYQQDDSIVSLKSEGMRELEFSEKL